MLISEAYRHQLAEKHRVSTQFGVSGAGWAPLVDQMVRAYGATTVLDYGCGRGTLREGLREIWNKELLAMPYQVLEYDPAIEGKETKPYHADVVVCGDVLEHIEPECLDEVLNDLHCTMQVCGLFVVSTVPAKKHLADGRNAHLIVEPDAWWLRKILAHWHLHQFQHSPKSFMAIVRPL